MQNKLKLLAIVFMMFCISFGGLKNDRDVAGLQEMDAVGNISVSTNANPVFEIITGMTSLNPCLIPEITSSLIVPSITFVVAFSDVILPGNLEVCLLRPPTI